MGSTFPAPSHDHHACRDDVLRRAERLCEKRGARLTALRRSVLEAVAQSHHAVGAYAIIDSLAGGARRPAPITVYRALDFLLAHGLLHKVESRNAFIACMRPHQGALAVLLICTGCGTIGELAGAEVPDALRRAAKRQQFAIERAVIELAGRCAGCQGLH